MSGCDPRPIRPLPGPSRQIGPVLAAAALLIGVLLSATPARAAVTSSNGRIAFSTDQSSNAQVFVVNPNGSGERQITDPSLGHAFAPDWSPDGTKIAFEGDGTGNHEIYVMNADGTHRTRITNEPTFDHHGPRFSPDGTKIALSRCPLSPPMPCVISVMNSDGTGLTPLTSSIWNSGDPAWSPDGTRIAFDSDKGGFFSAVWVMRNDGSHQHRITAPSLEASYPDWSPDGSHIVFSDHCCEPNSNVYVTNSDGSDVRQLTHVSSTHNAFFASYSPDGRKIVLASDLRYSGCNCADLYTVNADGTGLTRIVRNQPGTLLSDWGSSPA